MTKNTHRAINEFRRRLILREKNKIDAIVLYGSFVKGGYHPKKSDIDIVVLSDDKSIDEDILDIETAVSLKYGVVISALLATQKELEASKKAGYLFSDEIFNGEVIYERGKRRNKISR
ncbi:MAG TPA: nucleotidyltransferase domain-containing protein [Candidatus Omnitrophica bacterium]|nr:nucleotidyltransferase domain-containing protein [Candidatus Omnitrophota bacterium]